MATERVTLSLLICVVVCVASKLCAQIRVYPMSWFVNLSNSPVPNWSPYPASDSATIEAAFTAGDKTTLLNDQYKIDFNKLRQVRRDDAKRWREIKREEPPAPTPAAAPAAAAASSSSSSAAAASKPTAISSAVSIAPPSASAPRGAWLPNDLVGVVLSFLSARTGGLTDAFAVCRQWHALAAPRLDVELERGMSILFVNNGRCAPDAPAAQYRLLWFKCYDRDMTMLIDARPENSAVLALLNQHLCDSVGDGRFAHKDCEEGELKFEWIGEEHHDHDRKPDIPVMKQSFAHSVLMPFGVALRRVKQHQKRTRMDTNVIIVNQQLDMDKIKQILAGVKIDKLVDTTATAAAAGATPAPASAAAAASSTPAPDYSRFSLPVLKALVSKAGLTIAAGSTAAALIRQLQEHDWKTKGIPIPNAAAEAAPAPAAAATPAAKPTAKKRKGDDDDDEGEGEADDGPPAKKGRKGSSTSGSASASSSSALDEHFPLPGGAVHGSYSALLTQETKFIRLQVVSVGTAYYAYQRWGKLETKGQSANKKCSSAAEAIKEFEKKFKEKVTHRKQAATERTHRAHTERTQSTEHRTGDRLQAGSRQARAQSTG